VPITVLELVKLARLGVGRGHRVARASQWTSA
jgi:hypothetical protein